MSNRIRTARRSFFTGLFALGLAGATLPTALEAQTPLPVAQAAEFMGRWNVTIESDFGPLDVVLDLRDVEGNVVAHVGSDMGEETVTDISRAEDRLLLKYGFASPDGAEVPIVVTVSRDGEEIRTQMDVGGGMFTASGTGKRAAQ